MIECFSIDNADMLLCVGKVELIDTAKYITDGNVSSNLVIVVNKFISYIIQSKWKTFKSYYISVATSYTFLNKIHLVRYDV